MEVPSIEHLVATCHLGEVRAPAFAHVFVAPFPCRIAGAGLVTTNDVPESVRAYLTVALSRQRHGETRPMVRKTTLPETGEGIRANAYWHFDVCEWDSEARQLPTGSVVSLSVEGMGPVTGLRGVLVVVRYEPI